MEAAFQRSAVWEQTGADSYKWVRALGVGGLTFVALRQLPSYNVGVEFALLATVVLLSTVSLPGGILVSLFVMGYPIFYSSPVVGIAFAIIAVASFQYLSLVDGRAFFLLGFLLISVHYKMEWAFPVLAGFYLAGGSGFALGFCGALLLELMGLLLGRQSFGSLYANGVKVLWVVPEATLPSLTDWAWVAEKTGGGVAMRMLSAFARTAITSATLLVQPLIWGAVSAFVASSAEKRWKTLLIVFPIGIGALAATSLVVSSYHGLYVPASKVGQETMARAVLGLLIALVPVMVTMLGERRWRGQNVATGAVSTGSLTTAPDIGMPIPSGDVVDALTGLFRREYLDVSLPARIEAARQTGSSVAFCMIDLDRFKQVNDTKGHQAGDKVLTDVAGLLKSVVGTVGDVIRYGGDEFCVILPGFDADGAHQLMDRAAAELERFNFAGLENVLRPTFSMGIAEFPAMATTETDLVDCADQALYLSKNMGRNTITIYGEQVFREQAMELVCWMAMQCFLTVNGRIRADSWRLHPKQGPIEIVTAFDYTATIPYVSKTASMATQVKTYKSSFEGKILKIVSMSDNQTQFILLVQREDLPLKIKEHVAELEARGQSQIALAAGSEQDSKSKPVASWERPGKARQFGPGRS